MKTWVIIRYPDNQYRLTLQVSYKSFWLGFTFEFGDHLFIGIGPFTVGYRWA